MIAPESSSPMTNREHDTRLLGELLAPRKCLICRPVVRMTGGADHTGQDYFLRCPKCQTRTTHHVEGERVTAAIEQMLRKEWRAGRIETP